MWLFTKNSFVSVVQHREQPNNVLVRARKRGHLLKIFPKKEKQIQKTPNADYMWRVVVSKKELAKIVSDYIVRNLTYDNFKAANEKEDGGWPYFLADVWQAGLHYQEGLKK